MQNESKITIVLLNYNGREQLEVCLPSLEKDLRESRVPAEILVVDNGSMDGSLELLRDGFPSARTLAHGRNWGFAEGINHAIPAISTPYFALLNNDTEVEAGWLAALLERMEREPSAAAIQSRIMLFDRRHLIQSAGGAMTWHGYGYDRGFWRRPQPPWSEAGEVFFASAGAALYRRSAWDHVGPFDPEFFMYHEDVDWSWRAWLAGWRVLYEPASVIYHKMGATTSQVLGFSARQALGERHRIRTLLKLGAWPAALRRIFLGLKTKDPRRARLLLRCLLWNLRRLPDTLRLRKKVAEPPRYEAAERRIDSGLAPAELFATYQPASLERLTEDTPSELFAGREDLAWLGVGWHPPRAAWPGGPVVRWMADEAELLLRGSGPGLSLRLRLVGAELESGKIPEVQIEAGGRAWKFLVPPRRPQEFLLELPPLDRGLILKLSSTSAWGGLPWSIGWADFRLLSPGQSS